MFYSQRFREALARLLLLSFLSLICPSCGSPGSPFLDGASGSQSGPTQSQASTNLSGKVVLPGSVSLPLTTLKVLSAAGVSEVKSSGDFALQVPDGRPVLTMVSTPDDRLVLIGFVSPGMTFQTLSAESTAQALFFYALGGFTPFL